MDPLLNIFENEGFFSFKHEMKNVFIKKTIISKTENEELFENEHLMKYLTFVNKCSDRKGERCMFCYTKMEEDSFIVKVCNNFHFLCFCCRLTLLDNMKKCFLCKKNIVKESFNLFLSEITNKAKRIFLINTKNIPNLFYIKEHIKIEFDENFIFFEQGFLKLLQEASVQIIIKYPLNFLSNQNNNQKTLNNIFLNIYEGLEEKSKTNNCIFDYEKICRNYFWITGKIKNLLCLTNIKIDFFNFIEVESFWKSSEQEIDIFIKWCQPFIDYNFTIDKQKLFELNKNKNEENLVFCFTKNIGILLELEKIEDSEKKTYVFFSTDNNFFVLDSFCRNKTKKIPENVYFYNKKTTNFYNLKEKLKEIEKIYFIDNMKVFLLDNLINENFKGELIYFIEREIDLISFKENIKRIQNLKIYLDESKKKYIKELLKCENKSIFINKNKKLCLKNHSINILPKIMFSKDNEMEELICYDVKKKEHIKEILECENKSIFMGKVRNLFLKEYSIGILPKLFFNEDNEASSWNFYYNYKKEHIEEVLKCDNKSIFVGKIKILNFKKHSINILSKLNFHKDNEMEALMFYKCEKKEYIEEILKCKNKSILIGKLKSLLLKEYAINILPKLDFHKDNEMNTLVLHKNEKKEHIEEVMKCEKKSIFLGKIKELELQDYSVNILSKIFFPLNNEMDLFFCNVRKKEYIDFFFQYKDKSLFIGKIKTLKLGDYAINILPKLAFPLDNKELFLNLCYDYKKEHLKEILKYEDKSIFIGKIKKMFLKDYSINLLSKLKIPLDNEIELLEIVGTQECIENCIKHSKRIVFLRKTDFISFKTSTIDLIQIIKTKPKFTLILLVDSMDDLKKHQEKLVKLKPLIVEKVKRVLVEEKFVIYMKKIWSLNFVSSHKNFENEI